MARQSIESFDLATELGHPAESGRAREQVIRAFLERLIPPDYGIDTGFVIDALGGVSRQVDVVIYRKQRAPVLEIGGIKHFMVESVSAVVEVKASVTSREVLTEALDNVETVKALDRTNEGRNKVVLTQLPIDPDEFRTQIFTAVLAGRSMAYETTLEVMIDWIEKRPRRLWPNTYVDIRQYQIEYGSGMDGNGPPTTRSPDPTSAQTLMGTQSATHTWGLEPPLAFFAVDLLNYLRVSPLIDFHPYGYFHAVALPMDSHHVFPDDFGVREQRVGQDDEGNGHG